MKMSKVAFDNSVLACILCVPLKKIILKTQKVKAKLSVRCISSK